MISNASIYQFSDLLIYLLFVVSTAHNVGLPLRKFIKTGLIIELIVVK